jgi:hypothetical protein
MLYRKYKMINYYSIIILEHKFISFKKINIHTIINKGKKSFLYQQMCIKDYQFCTCWYKIIALVKFKKLNKYLGFIFL